jgi:succinate dehydrogenase / fumarate reductase flavoprotein subunit
MREIREGRGSPHGGVYLDISWIKERVKDGEEHIKRKLPSMYHQFKELAGIDITKEAMEVGPTTHYMMGGVRVDPETQMSTGAGPVRRRRGRGGASRRQPPWRELAVGSSRLRPAGRRIGRGVRAEPSGAHARRRRGRGGPAHGPRPRSTVRPGTARGRTTSSTSFRKRCKTWSASSAAKDEMVKALEIVKGLSERAKTVRANGNREYNPGWHTALDLRALLTVSEAITRAAIERRESRGAQFRDDYPDKNPEFGKITLVVRKGRDGAMTVTREPLPPLTAEQQAIIEEMK